MQNTSSTAFTLGHAAGTDLVGTVTSGSFTRSTPLAPKYDVVASATTSWSGTGVLGSFTAQYTDARGLRSGQDSGDTSTIAGSWSKLLNLGDGLKSTFTFNGYGELASAPTPTWQNSAGSQVLSNRNWSWTYDLAGNRLTEVGPSLTNYTPDAMNRYSAITGSRAEAVLTYDADGNLTQDGTWTYAYDAENRLISVSKAAQTLTLAYDCAGRRIRKTVTGTGAYDIKFLWNGWNLAADLQADGYNLVRSYIWGPDQSGGWGHHGALLGTYNASSVLSYALADALGNIVGYISGGAITTAVEYSAYGKAVNVFGPYADHPIGLSGEYMDWEAGIIYYGLRYYAPKHGRFINRDPIEEAGGVNLYGFVGNSPTNGWDFLGLDEYDSPNTAGSQDGVRLGFLTAPRSAPEVAARSDRCTPLSGCRPPGRARSSTWAARPNRRRKSS